MNQTILPVLLCGGAGTRLWPASTVGIPKPFLPLVGSQTMISATLDRVADRTVFADPIIVAGREHRYLLEATLAEAATAATLILEPEPMSTTAAIAAAAEWVSARDPETVLLFLAADHVIRDRDGFRRTVERARPAAEAGYIVVFGIQPSGPETGFGYIRRGLPLEQAPDASAVDQFVEKPAVERARELVAEGALWNSGNFMMTVSTAKAEIGRHAPATATAVSRAVHEAETDDNVVDLARKPFLAAEAISFDHAILEKTDRAAVVTAAFDWIDAGTWSSIWEVSDQDPSGNVTAGEPLLAETSGSLVRSDGPVVGIVGMRDIVVIAANNAVLVAPRDRAGEVKQLAVAAADVGENVIGGRGRHYRPWGYYQSVDIGPTHQVKRLLVNPGARLSLQKHAHRAEHWTIVAGTAEVTIDDTVQILGENQSIFIPLGAVHRAANPGTIPTLIIEVQYGDYLGEDDIIRLQDDYGRLADEESS